MNHDTNSHVNNQLDDQFMTTLRETYPVEQKEQLRAKLTQVTPEKRWWRLTMKQNQSFKNRQIMPRLAGVVALLLIAAVSFTVLNNSSDTTVMIDSPDSIENQPKEAIAKQQNTPNFEDAPEVANVFDISYKWAAGDYPTVPDTLPQYTFTSAYPKSDEEKSALAAQIGINDATLYDYNPFSGSGMEVIALHGDDGRTVVFMDDIQQMVYQDHPELQDRFTPLPAEDKISAVEQFITTYSAWGAADEVLVESDGLVYAEYNQQRATLSPQISISNIESSIPVYDPYYRSLGNTTVDVNGTVVEVNWSSIKFEKTDKIDGIVPALDALNMRGRHSSKSSFESAGRDYTYRNINPHLNELQDGDTITLRGRINIIVNQETGKESTVLYLNQASLFRQILLDVEIAPTDIGHAQVEGIFRLQEDGYIIEVTSWEKMTSGSGCRQGIITQLDPVTFVPYRSETAYILPDAPADLQLDDMLELCADDWSNDELDWHELQQIKPEIDNADDDTERTITAARLIYKMEDFLGGPSSPLHTNNLKLLWEFTGLNEDGRPFTLYVRANSSNVQEKQETVSSEPSVTTAYIMVNDVTYLWEGDAPAVPDTVPAFTYEQTSIQTVDDMKRVAEGMGALNPDLYYTNYVDLTQDVADSKQPQTHEFRGENQLTIFFNPLEDVENIFTAPQSHKVLVRTTQLPDTPISFEQQKEQITAIVDGQLTSPYLIEPNGEHIGTLTPALDIEGLDTPVPIYDYTFSPLSQFVFDENGDVSLIWWRTVEVETAGKGSIMPPLEALSKASRHQSQWDRELIPDTEIYRQNREFEIGDSVTLLGVSEASVHAENGTVDAVLYTIYDISWPQFQETYLLRGDALRELRSSGLIAINGIARVDSDGTEYIEVTDWEHSNVDPGTSGCRTSVVEQITPAAVIKTDGLWTPNQTEFKAETYRLPELSDSVTEGQRLLVCTADWSQETIDWQLILPLENTEHQHTEDKNIEYTITSARLIYQLGDEFTKYELTPYWDFRGETETGYPFTLMVRAD